MSQRLTKSGFHLLLATVAVLEIAHAETDFRRACAGAWCGFHFVLAVQDFRS